MTQEQSDMNNAIYVFGMIVLTLVEAMAMFSENMECVMVLGETCPHPREHFDEVIEKNGCHHNGIVSNLHPGR